MNSSSSSPSSPKYVDFISVLSEIRTIEILFALLVFVVIRTLHQKKHQGLPNWPLIGMLPSLIIGLQGNVYDWITNVLVRTNGTFIFRGPCFTNLHCVVTSDPGNVEYILKKNFSNFEKGDYFRDTVNDLLGEGIFSADGETWRRQRKIASIEFHSSKFKKMIVDSLIELVHRRLLPVLDDAVEKSVSIDLQDVLLRLTFDNVCMIALGVDPGCLSPGMPEVPFAKAFEEATESTTIRFVTPTLVWKTMRWLGVGSEGRLKEAIRGVDDFAKEVIKARKSNSNMKTNDLLSVFMGFDDFSDKSLRDICVNFILAGRDTSSVALTWFFWLLKDHPEVEEKILQEIDAIVRKRQTQDRDIRDSTFHPEEVKKMEYLQAALSEALRLYPSVPVDHKEVVVDDVFPDGTVLKKRTKVVYAIYAMGRDEEIWGKDCKEFKPERWLSENGRFSGVSAYKFAAFNGGPRLCLGKDFAYYQMKFVVASILRRYHVKVVANHPVVPKMALTMYLKHGLKVHILDRYK